MKALVLEKKLELNLRDIDLPTEVGPDDVKIKMHTVGICGSDIHYYEHGKIGQWHVNAPMVLGHEGSGTVIEVGENEKVLKIGDRVCIEPQVVSKKSREYKLGMYNYDQQVKFWATPPIHGCLTPEVIFPGDMVFKIPDNLSFAEGAMIEPLACCVRAWKKCEYNECDSTAIFGVGPTGMMHVMLAQAKKFSKIFCFDVNDFRLDFAKKFNITQSISSMDENRKQKILDQTNNLGVDVAIVATSSLKALEDAIDMVRKGGTVMMFGVPSKGAMINLDMSKVYSKEITLVTSYAASDADTKDALELIESSQIDGAGFWQLILRIIMPLQAHVILVSVILNLIGGIQIFDLVFVLAKGPIRLTHSADVLSMYMIFNSFAGSATGGGQARLGYAASIAVIMMLIMIVFAVLRTRLRKYIDY